MRARFHTIQRSPRTLPGSPGVRARKAALAGPSASTDEPALDVTHARLKRPSVRVPATRPTRMKPNTAARPGMSVPGRSSRAFRFEPGRSIVVSVRPVGHGGGHGEHVVVGEAKVKGEREAGPCPADGVVTSR